MLGSEYASYFDERIFLNGVDRENEACLDCVQLGESGYVTAREKPSHHQGNERTHHRPMFPPAVPSSSRWLQSFEGRVSSFWAVTSQPGKSPERVPPHCCHLASPVGAHWTRSELSCRLWSLQVSSLCLGMTFTLSSLKVECHRLQEPTAVQDSAVSHFLSS